MYFHYINKLVNIPEIRVLDMSFEDDQGMVFFRIEPVRYVQDCPCCGSSRVKRNGTLYHRQVRHLPLMEWRTILLVPAINMKCKQCDATFVWEYEFVGPKETYSHALQNQLIQQGHGTTVKAMAGFQAVPYTTAEHYYKKGLQAERERIQATCIQDAIKRDRLVLGIDDFAVRKGHTYNTGIHDLKGGSFLDLISGRTTEDLQNFKETSSYIHALNPIAVVMDMSYTYHQFVKETFPHAIRIADRFHVNRYVTDAMHEVRKEIQKTLSSQARKQLKRHHRLLEKRFDALSTKEQTIVETILKYDERLKAAYKWKEDFIDWYDLSTDAKQAKRTLDRWYKQGHHICHDAVESCIKTIQNWEAEVLNYHRMRFTNAVVEGRHNKIKALQRRHYFTRNRNIYENRILVECNWNYMLGIA